MTSEDVVNTSGSAGNCCCVVILHETQETLQRATALCDRLLETSWKDMDLQMTRWSMELLSGIVEREQAAAAAAAAHVVVIAANPAGPFPEGFRAWTEQWLARRGSREGALVGLFVSEDSARHIFTPRADQLHRLAVQAGMDYLTHLPDSPAGGLPDAMDWFTQRATTQTGTLSRIVGSEPRPSAL